MLRSSRSTVSARLRLSMRTPNSMLPCSALQEKLALVTRRKRWSMARNLAWLRTRAAVEAASPQHRGRAELLSDLGGGGRGRAVPGGRVPCSGVQIEPDGELGSSCSLAERGPQARGPLEVEG